MTNCESLIIDELDFDREGELSELEKTKAGVKGIVDSGIDKVPKIFYLPKEYQLNEPSATDHSHLQVPVIDLQVARSDVVRQIRRASQEWGIFQLINHGIPQGIISHMLQSTQQFHEQPVELKEEFYSRDSDKKVQYHVAVPSQFGTAVWKDTLACHFEKESLAEDFEKIPNICRKQMSDYLRYMIELKDTLSELLSEALGLKSDYLKQAECMEAERLQVHYYPACPEPDLTIGTPRHSDPYFLAILVQNHINGLQVLHDHCWVNVNPEEGALIANIGDMLQLISNDIFKSVEHRAPALKTGPRLTGVCFFYPSGKNKDRAYGPIKELTEGNVIPVYQKTSLRDYLKSFMLNGVGGHKALLQFKQ